MVEIDAEEIYKVCEEDHKASEASGLAFERNVDTLVEKVNLEALGTIKEPID